MTATTKPPGRESKPRPIRFISMETLGFSNPSSIWTDSPQADLAANGRRITVEQSATVADWQPGDFENQLTGRDFRWGLFAGALILITGLAAAGFWLYQRPAAEAEASVASVTEMAEDLSASLAGLEQFNAALPADTEADTTSLFAADAAARALFDASGDLDASQSATRSAAAAAASAVLDGVRLAGDAHSYRLAVLPVLTAPGLETDPGLIELDEAARSFGDWQLRFDDVRTALPDGVLPDVTEHLDVLSGDLNMVLGDYVDSLRRDDAGAAEGVLASLSARLEGISAALGIALEDIQDRVSERIAESQAALAGLLDTPQP